METINDWCLALDNHLVTDAIYIDFQKAFDSVSHVKLYSKLISYNIEGDLLQWINAFLSNRTQQVKIINSVSNVIDIISGVPQGSVLGPTLFLLYINDLTDILSNVEGCSVKLYADDVKLYSSFKIANYSVDLVTMLDRITEWAIVWQLKIATNKCVSHRIVSSSLKNNDKYCYKLNDFLLDWSENTKDLGITIDTHLEFKQHIANIVHTAHTRVNLILKCFVSRDREVLVKAYITYVRPILEYCAPVWSPYRIGLIKKIEDVQRRFTTRLAGLQYVTYIERANILCLDLLQIRRIKLDLIMCYNIIRGNVGIECPRFFKIVKSSRTRGHNYKIYKQECHLDVCKYSFARRVVDIWNDLPSCIVNAESVNSFKNRLNTVDFTHYI